MKVAFVSGARSEWRLVEPMLRAASDHRRLTPRLLVTGSHLSERHGHTVDTIRAAGFEPAACVEILEPEDTPLATARATGRAIGGLAEALSSEQPAWVVVSGDRYESFAAAVAATMLGVPLAHVAGGETDLATNQDCNLRNAMTKLAQAHFVANERAAERVLAMGEEPWRVHVVGLPSLDDIETQAGPRDSLVEGGLAGRDRGFLLLSYLPVTLRPVESLRHLGILLAALDRFDRFDKLFVLANADADADEHDRQVALWARGREDVKLVPALHPELYLAALKHCACFVGNSSSGVIESPAFGTPAVIVGSRQDGRPLAENVRHVGEPEVETLAAAIEAQADHGRYEDAVSPFGGGGSSRAVCDALCELRNRPDLMSKRLLAPEPVA